MSDAPILDHIAQRRSADIAKLKLIAASGFKGAVAARQTMQRLRTEELRESLR
jgi:hypothetical protein